MPREIKVEIVEETVRSLCLDANVNLGGDIIGALQEWLGRERSPAGRSILNALLENALLAAEERMPVCQDTGMVTVFMETGQDVWFTGGNLAEAVDRGVRRAYREGFFRASVVADPLRRENTGDNTPALIYNTIVPGDRVKITVAPKGFGSENTGGVRMFTPAAGLEGVKEFILDTVEKAGASPCPPVIVGVGVGGTMDYAALLAKKALLVPVGIYNAQPEIAAIEKELWEKINRTGIGPQGLGGSCTALAVHILTGPTHIAGLPAAVNIGCHATRHKEKVI
ncbi:MAG: fumarate hydratase [Bacillota bacterium]